MVVHPKYYGRGKVIKTKHMYGNKRDFFKTKFFEWSPNEILIPLMFIMVGKKLWHIYCVLLTYSLEKKSFGLCYPHTLQRILYLINYTSLTSRIKSRLFNTFHSSSIFLAY